MAAGGKWSTQNKRRPGPYINFVATPRATGALGDRGVVAIAIPMIWGPQDELIEVFASDLVDGKSLAKVGYTINDIEESLPLRLALSRCYKALVYRADAGGIEASVTLQGTLTATAKYAGTAGNNLAVAITANGASSFNLTVLFKGAVKETFKLTVLADIEDIVSEWVELTPAQDGTLKEAAATTLGGGTNGALASDYTPFVAILRNAQWNCVAVQSTDTGATTALAAAIKDLRENKGKKVQAVVFGEPGSQDYEGILTVNQGFNAGDDIVGTNLFPLWVASITAGAAVNESNTGLVVPSATRITNELTDDATEKALAAGHFVISYRQDGAVVVEQDINSLHTYDADRSYVFSKNRVIRCLDEIGNTTALTFNRYFKGKVDNNASGRNLYKAQLIQMCTSLQNLGAIDTFDGAVDITVLPGEEVDGVVVDLAVKPIDSMEKLYMTVNVIG